MNKLLIICGPTATGKTKLALQLAKKFDGELINADSQQVYKGLDALTGKDRSDEVPIWLYDVVSPEEEFSVAHFVRLADEAISDVVKRKKLPIVIGGTGFYLRALTQNVDTIFIPPNQNLRKRLAGTSVDQLQKELERVDPDKWKIMNDSDQKNPRRLIRAIEVTAASAAAQRKPESFNVLWIGLMASLPFLKNRIAERVTERFENAATEVRPGLPPILGADPLLSHAHGLIAKEEAIEQWTNAEYAYARRQMTWFRKEKVIEWFDIEDPNYRQQIEQHVYQWYTDVS
ncbi:tRNA (adenosine(37)-N6)-dimethylallyltransferase MiaA [Candidatus Gottesmanbacteria bacterium]|nr:tRNA (adenosine(37)-N6)-dimethylallyltransferase MiaA [Candidatus Gottesmanbacteria bacterium]